MGRTTRPLLERFSEKWTLEPTLGCWLWSGAKYVQGYGKLWDNGEIKAHRAAWKIFRGDIPEGLHVLHHCDTPSCVNPDHLFLGTDLDNVTDCVQKGRFAVGESNGRSKLSEDQILAIRKDSRTQLVIAADYGTDQGTISRIKNGKCWKHIKT